ncbi:MAG: hypothetical protein PHQ64_02780 [Bacilli bacterium]|nr:hypothetical protein [Bacilli bacterium]
MENKINKIIVLGNNKKYAVLNQAIYKDKNYFFVVGVTDDEEDLTDEFRILEENVRDNKRFVSPVKDQATIDLLSKYLKPREI